MRKYINASEFYPEVFIKRSYSNIPVLGNSAAKDMFGVIVYRYYGWMGEPSQLAFFFGLNILAAKNFIINRKKLKRFARLNAIASLTTLSITFLFTMEMFFYITLSL